MAPETIVQTHGSRAQPVNLPVALIHDKPETTDPTKGDIPPAFVFDHLGGIVFDFAGFELLSLEFLADGLFGVVKRIVGDVGHGVTLKTRVHRGRASRVHITPGC